MFGNYTSPGKSPGLFNMGIPISARGGSGNPTVGRQNFGEVVGGLLQQGQGKVTLKDIKWALGRFPELTYHLSAIATFVSHANPMPWANRRALGPAGINVTFSSRKTTGQVAAKVISNALTRLREAGIDVRDVLPELEKVAESAALPDESFGDPKQVAVMREVCGELIDANKVQQKLYKAALSLLMYNVCIFEYTEDYSEVFIYTPEELIIEKEEEVKEWGKSGATKQKVKLKIADTGEDVSERAHAVTVGQGDVKESVVGKVIHYLRIIDLIETAMSVERVSKSISFLVWLVGVDNMPGEQVTDYLGAYRGIVMNRLKAGMNDNNLVSSEISKTLTSTHLFVPTYKDSPTDVKSFNLQYRPMLEDIQYWWQKVFMAMGIPPYYTDTEKLQGSPGDVTHFHESVFGANVRAYQTLLEGITEQWVLKFLQGMVGKDTLKDYKMVLSLPIYISSGEEARSEYMQRINQFASAYSTLSVSGLPIRPDFATQLLFPNADPRDVIDFQVRDLNLGVTSEQTTGAPAKGSRYDPKVVDSMIGNMVSGQIQASPTDRGGQSTTNTSPGEVA